MSEGKYIRLGTVNGIRHGMGQTIITQRGGAPAEVREYSQMEQTILKFLEGMPDDADVHIEVSKDLWR